MLALVTFKWLLELHPRICLLRQGRAGQAGCQSHLSFSISQKLSASVSSYVWPCGIEMEITVALARRKLTPLQLESPEDGRFLLSLLCHPQHVGILTAASWPKKAAGAPAFLAVFAHFICVLQVGRGALFVMITQGSVRVEQPY